MAEEEESPLRATIELCEEPTMHKVHVTYTLYNTSDKPLSVLERDSPLWPIANAFDILDAAGEEVPYNGKVRRLPPQSDDDWLDLAPRAHLAVTREISHGFELQPCCSYTVRPPNSHRVRESSSDPEGTWRAVACDPLVFTICPEEDSK
eukprot:TRINITY_DN2750_c0_g1_i4.p1 TRINITY_DN2750_c0_g1~~TRINITY_DN2750_c0_g1_i4.p1  ORF type:complete len:149 (+),score=33.47 TRINITY_DN2750_c0_g1_i4:155-601(+)